MESKTWIWSLNCKKTLQKNLNLRLVPTWNRGRERKPIGVVPPIWIGHVNRPPKGQLRHMDHGQRRLCSPQLSLSLSLPLPLSKSKSITREVSNWKSEDGALESAVPKSLSWCRICYSTLEVSTFKSPTVFVEQEGGRARTRARNSSMFAPGADLRWPMCAHPLQSCSAEIPPALKQIFRNNFIAEEYSFP